MCVCVHTLTGQRGAVLVLPLELWDVPAAPELLLAEVRPALSSRRQPLALGRAPRGEEGRLLSQRRQGGGSAQAVGKCLVTCMAAQSAASPRTRPSAASASTCWAAIFRRARNTQAGGALATAGTAAAAMASPSTPAASPGRSES